MNLRELLKRLDSLSGTITPDSLSTLLGDFEPEVDELAEYLHFSEAKYQRNLIHRNDGVEVLLLCFEPGQRTPIHDHAGSVCGVKVVQGVAVETVYEYRLNHWLYPTETNELGPGGVVGSNDMDTHELANSRSNGERLVTLHVYSPPLEKVGNYSTIDNQRIVVTTVANAPERHSAV